jgi:hypothetical protein
MILRILEALGVRVLYGAVSSDPLPGSAEVGKHALSSTHLDSEIEGAHYHLIANVVRGAFYVVPPIIGVMHQVWLVALLSGAVLLLHILVIITEFYRGRLCRAHLPASADIPAPEPELSTDPLPGEIWFRPKKWESIKLYLMLGVGPIQWMVQWYESRQFLSKDQREAGEKARSLQSLGRIGLLKFVDSIRFSEIVHSVNLVVNIAIFAFAWAGGVMAAAWWILIPLLADWELVMLQRMHRLRIWRTYMIMRRRAR